MKIKDYEIRQRPSDKKWCIYLRAYNAVVAVFSTGCESDARKFKIFFEKESKK